MASYARQVQHRAEHCVQIDRRRLAALAHTLQQGPGLFKRLLRGITGVANSLPAISDTKNDRERSLSADTKRSSQLGNFAILHAPALGHQHQKIATLIERHQRVVPHARVIIDADT